MRGAAALAVAATFALLAGAGSAAADTSVEIYPPDNGGRFPTRGGIFIRGDSLGNRVQVSYLSGRGEFEVRDARSRLKLRTGDPDADRCLIVNPHRARCENPESSPKRAVITVPLRTGDDVFLPARNLTASIAVSGGPGADEVNGALGGDLLKGGGPGLDVVDGHAGRDTILGGEGDILSGGRDSDLILADDGSVEGSIDCGGGKDRAYVDSADAETLNCERVTVRDPGAARD